MSFVLGSACALTIGGDFLPTLRGLRLLRFFRRAYAAGCILSPLRGCIVVFGAVER
jgi:hypothetical protein